MILALQEENMYLAIKNYKLETEMDEIKRNEDNSNRQIQAVAQVIDDSILSSYKLWPTNFIAHDLMHNSTLFRCCLLSNIKCLSYYRRRLIFAEMRHW